MIDILRGNGLLPLVAARIEQVQTAASYGASTILLGRPFATAICRDKENEIKNIMKKLRTWES